MGEAQRLHILIHEVEKPSHQGWQEGMRAKEQLEHQDKESRSGVHQDRGARGKEGGHRCWHSAGPGRAAGEAGGSKDDGWSQFPRGDTPQFHRIVHTGMGQAHTTRLPSTAQPASPPVQQLCQASAAHPKAAPAAAEQSWLWLPPL